MPYSEVFLREAIRLSEEHMIEGDGGPFGAVVVKDGKIIARGWNRVTSAKDPTAHAEIMAIREACAVLDSFSLKGCSLYASCEPCPMCLAAIYWARLDELYYAATREDAADAGFDDALLYHELAEPPGNRTLKTEHYLDDEARKVFSAWKAKSDKTAY